MGMERRAAVASVGDTAPSNGRQSPVSNAATTERGPPSPKNSGPPSPKNSGAPSPKNSGAPSPKNSGPPSPKNSGATSSERAPQFRRPSLTKPPRSGQFTKQSAVSHIDISCSGRPPQKQMCTRANVHFWFGSVCVSFVGTHLANDQMGEMQEHGKSCGATGKSRGATAGWLVQQ